MTPAHRLVVLAIAVASLATACSEVTESDPLPWLRVKKTFHKPIGGLAGGTTQYDYYVKRFGFVWVKLDETATGPAIPLDPGSAVISTAQGLKLLARGEENAALACGSLRSVPVVLAEAGVVDCFDLVAGPAAATQLRWRRISGRGEALVVEKLRVENAGRHFARAMASFYDAGHQPYFVTLNDDPARPSECALVWIAGGEARSIPAPADLPSGRCSDTGSWASLVKRPLRKA